MPRASRLSKHKFTLWWIPCAEDRSRLQSVITSLARKHSTTAFSPHVTVCSSIEDAGVAIELGELLAKNQRPFEVVPECLEHSNAFYRAFTIRLKIGDSLRDARAVCVAKAGIADKLYLPHLSLMYQHGVDFDPVVFRQCPGDILRVFEIDRLDLLDASGEIEDWQLLQSFALDVK